MSENVLRNRRLRELGWQLHRSALYGRLIAPLTPSGILFFHHGRCGSTVVARLLNQHPRLRTFGEIFDEAFRLKALPAPAVNMLRACRTVALPARAVAEVKFLECQHLATFPYTMPEFLEQARAAGYDRYIVLDRRNYLHKVISAAVASARGGAGKLTFKLDETVPETTIELDLEAVRIQGKAAPILQLFEYMDVQNAKLRQHLAGADTIELTYEDDIEPDPQIAYAKICTWLGLERHAVQVPLKRARATPVPETVRNWDAVAAALAGTRYEWMLR